MSEYFISVIEIKLGQSSSKSINQIFGNQIINNQMSSSWNFIKLCGCGKQNVEWMRKGTGIKEGKEV